MNMQVEANTTVTETPAPAKVKAPKVKTPAKPKDVITGPYAGALKRWPKAYGPVPTRIELAKARALVGGRAGSKRELAVAAYLRPCAGSYTTGMVAWATKAVFNDTYNPILNVVNAELGADGAKLVNVVKTKIHPKGHKAGLAYVLTPTKAGQRVIDKFFEANGLTVATPQSNVPVATETPLIDDTGIKQAPNGALVIA
jgi:hypothetical protein